MPTVENGALVGLSPWLYVQSTGALYRPDGSHCADGYSGHKAGVNNPDMQRIRDVGPIPCGVYVIGTARDHPMLGPVAIPLTPDVANVMFGRSHFYCHGDNQAHDRSASMGCIIMPRPAREELALGKSLKVIPRPASQEVVSE